MFKLFSYTLVTVLTVDLLATSGDIHGSWTSPVLPKLSSNDSEKNPFEEPISEDEESWIASLLNIGAMIGPFPYGFLAEKFGRKVSLLCIAVPHIMAYLIFAFSKTLYGYYIARILGGIAVGGGYTILPMYVAEVSEDAKRGMFSTTLNIFWNFGNTLPYVMGPYIPMLWFNIILACIPATFFILFFLIAPETPYYLIMKHKTDKAEKALMKLRSHNKKTVETEIAHIQSEIEKHTKNESVFKFFKSKIYMKGLTLSLVLIIAQQLSGVNAIVFYTQDIFSASGNLAVSPEISGIILAAVACITSFFIPFLVDRAGRRILLLISLLGMSLSLLCFGIYFYLERSTDVDVSPISWLPLVSLLAYTITFGIGTGPLPWTISSELFPTSVKPYAATLVSCTSWMTSFFVTKFFNEVKSAIGQGETFWLFAGCCFLASIFTYFFIPETKEKSFQEIQDILKHNN